ncbi:hypothetical protein DPEC_G00329430 [Dallia pectoralis]|uniref:Uncharacterized protein n=1 Tax=Dallia pectoralis TaxID=75939 RepID=A0ACC2F8R1_DALPE|nr:hypothetical protein DPEC_G00329430 [Dallia pectoralis]
MFCCLRATWSRRAVTQRPAGGVKPVTFGSAAERTTQLRSHPCLPAVSGKCGNFTKAWIHIIQGARMSEFSCSSWTSAETPGCQWTPERMPWVPGYSDPGSELAPLPVPLIDLRQGVIATEDGVLP